VNWIQVAVARVRQEQGLPIAPDYGEVPMQETKEVPVRYYPTDEEWRTSRKKRGPRLTRYQVAQTRAAIAASPPKTDDPSIGYGRQVEASMIRAASEALNADSRRLLEELGLR